MLKLLTDIGLVVAQYPGEKFRDLPCERIQVDGMVTRTWVDGRRDSENARRFLVDVARRMRGRIRLTTDSTEIYREAAWDAFTGFVDYAMLQKIYASPMEAERRYSPPVGVGIQMEILQS